MSITKKFKPKGKRGKYNFDQTVFLLHFVEKVGYATGYMEASYEFKEKILFEVGREPTNKEVLDYLTSALVFHGEGREIITQTLFEKEGI